jgi:hypothetical protein
MTSHESRRAVDSSLVPDVRAASGQASGTDAPPITAIYLAYGAPRIVRIAAFSALTFLHVAKELPSPSRVVVYTDRPKIFRQVGITSDLVPLSALQDRMPEYPFRTKITAMLDAASRYPGCLLFVDGDTYFTAPPIPQLRAMARGDAVMHKPDCRVTVAGCRGVVDLDKLAAAGAESPSLPTFEDWPAWIWNSGVIGIGESRKHLIADALAACDEIYAGTGSRISEQMAWTLVLSEAGKIVDACDEVYHYWGTKEQLMYEIVAFLRRNRTLAPADLAAKAYALRPRASDEWKPPLAVRARIAARTGRKLILRNAHALAHRRA